MLTKLSGLARAVAILLAILAGFVALGGMNIALSLVALGLLAGLALPEDRMVTNLALVIALPIVGAALMHIPMIGAQLNAVAMNLQLAVAGGLAMAIAIRLYQLVMGGVMGLAGPDSTGKPAVAAR
jgi:hypothetical protein